MSGTAGIFAVRDTRELSSLIDLVDWRGEINDTSVTNMGWQIVTTGAAALATHGPITVAFHGWLPGYPKPMDAAIELADQMLTKGTIGIDCHAGAFAAIVADERSGQLHGIRDWIGSRPLFWGNSGSTHALGSEPLAIPILLGHKPRVDEQNLGDYLARRRPSVRASFVEGATALSPGCILSIDHHHVVEKHQPSLAPKLNLSDPAALEGVRTRLDQAITERLAGAQSIAAHASGGVDSGVVAALAGARGALREIVTHRVDGLPEADETHRAVEIADRYEVGHRVVELPAIDVLTEVENNILVHGPTHPTMWLSGSTITAAAHAGHDLLLTGHLGDEWLTMAGGPLAQAAWSRQPGATLAFARDAKADRNISAARTTKLVGKLIVGGVVKQRRYGTHALNTFIDDAWVQRTLLGIERVGSLTGIRVESPLADFNYAQFVLGLDAWQRNRPGQPKRILRDACADVLPDDYVSDPIKANFFDVPEMAFNGEFEGAEAWNQIRSRWAKAWRIALDEL